MKNSQSRLSGSMRPPARAAESLGRLPRGTSGLLPPPVVGLRRQGGLAARDARPRRRLPAAQRRQIAELAAYGERRGAEAGDVLFREGDEHYDFFVVLDGMVAVVEGTVAPTSG